MLTRILHFTYNLLFHIILPFLIILEVFLLIKNGKKGWAILSQRLAFYKPIPQNSPVIWYHASSLGEVLSLIPLMQELKKVYPHTQVLSVNTVRGEQIAREKKSGDYIIFFPLDLCYFTSRAFRKIKPKLIIVFETEIWPNFYWESMFRKVPLFIVSGRISEKSFPRYKLLKFLFSNVLQSGKYLMKSEIDAQRIEKIGAPKQNIIICGDIKYDGLKTELLAEEKALLAKKIFANNEYWIIVGSTHRGEEKILAEAFAKLKEEFPKIKLLIAPRHLERILEVTKVFNEKKLSYQLRTKIENKVREDIVILDTYGELSKAYYFANIVFVGGSLVPIGGHNVMEAIAYGKPVITGNHYANFRRSIQSLKEQNAIKIVSGIDELVETMRFFIKNPRDAAEMGQKGQKIVMQSKGALAKCINIISESLK